LVPDHFEGGLGGPKGLVRVGGFVVQSFRLGGCDLQLGQGVADFLAAGVQFVDVGLPLPRRPD
jgi:hypothetical protein